MLRDITIGQHFPGNSVLHRCDPRLKLVATIAYIVVLFVAPNPLGLALSIALLAALYKVAKIPGKLILKSLKPIVPIVLFTAVLNLFFVTGEGEPLVHIWVLKIYGEGIRYAILLTVRVCALIAGTSLLTYTTSPIVLTDAIENLLRPLAKIHFPVHEGHDDDHCAAVHPDFDRRDREDHERPESPRCHDRQWHFHPAHQGAGAGADPAVHLGLPPRGRAGYGHGVPLLPRRRGPHPVKAAEVHGRGYPLRRYHHGSAAGDLRHPLLCAGVGVIIF